MSLWGSTDSANSVPKNLASLLNRGSGTTGQQALNTALYDNTTANTVYNGVTISAVLITPDQIATGAYPGAVAGWNIKRTGSGGRAGRVTYENITPLGGVNAAQFADGQAAPQGFHWEFVTDDTDGSRITDDVTGQPVVDLVAN